MFMSENLADISLIISECLETMTFARNWAGTSMILGCIENINYVMF